MRNHYLMKYIMNYSKYLIKNNVFDNKIYMCYNFVRYDWYVNL